MGYNLFGRDYLSEGSIKLDLDDTYSSFSYLGIDESFEFVKWHCRLRHIGKERMNKLAKEHLLESLNKVIVPICEPCLTGEAHKKS